MATFLIGILLIFVGGWAYSAFLQKLFRPDDRETPAVRLNDGVDFVPMKKWKNALINLLNIAGTGPIFGPIQGILFGPIAFLTIPIGCVISGATHDYLSGMISMRQDGKQMPRIIRNLLGDGANRLYTVFLFIMLLLLSAVFTYTPGDLLAGDIFHKGDNMGLIWGIYGAIMLYYLAATLFPIDKIIGRVYPVFGAILLMSAVGVFVGIFTHNYQLMNVSLENGLLANFNMYPLWDVPGAGKPGTPFIPVFFVTVACGITSGFHSTQCTLIGRSISSEKEGRFTFYWTMILEGLIAMIWAAAAMGLYNNGVLVANTAVVGEVARDLLGPVGGTLAVLGVIILPITSGDTALRSCRLMLGESLHINQQKPLNRLLTTLAIVIPVCVILVFAKLDKEGFNILWRYFAWANQVVAVFSFAVITVYLKARPDMPKFAYLVGLLPGMFYCFIVSSFICFQNIGFGLPLNISYAIAAAVTLVYGALCYRRGGTYPDGKMLQ